MSLLIKCVEMPDNCFECPCCEEEQMDYRGHILLYTCRAILDDAGDYERRPDCPLSEIPTPHGRLIDAGALLKTIEANDYMLRSAEKHGGVEASTMVIFTVAVILADF